MTSQTFDALNNYSWENFRMTLFGHEAVYFNSFELDFESDLELTYGKGGEVTGYASKKKKHSAKATVLMEEMEYLVGLASPWGGSLLYLPPAPITAESSPENRRTLKLTIPAVKFAKYNFMFKEDDAKVEVPLEMAVLARPILRFV